jgi:hypothetical protein
MFVDHYLPTGNGFDACITCYGQRKKPLHTVQKEKKNFLTITVLSDESSSHFPECGARLESTEEEESSNIRVRLNPGEIKQNRI